MSYIPDFIPSCQKAIEKATKKNPLLGKILNRKVNEIIQFPHHYKSLRHALAGKRRVHILRSFVLSFKIDEPNKTVVFLKFGHHDQAY